MTRTPLRISFAGGGTDLAAFYERDYGAVFSTAIDRYVYVTVKRHSELFYEPIRINYSKTEQVNELPRSRTGSPESASGSWRLSRRSTSASSVTCLRRRGLGDRAALPSACCTRCIRSAANACRRDNSPKRPRTSKSTSSSSRSASKTSMPLHSAASISCALNTAAG